VKKLYDLQEHRASACIGSGTLQDPGSDIMRMKFMGGGMILLMSPFRPWQRQMGALSTSDLKAPQHAAGGVGTVVSVRKAMHGISPISGVRHSVGCAGGGGGVAGVTGVAGVCGGGGVAGATAGVVGSCVDGGVAGATGVAGCCGGDGVGAGELGEAGTDGAGKLGREAAGGGGDGVTD
jgi:hypothetical protein